MNSDQEHERHSLKTILEEDQHNLLSLQEESRLRMEQQHADERRQLEKNIDDRLRKLNEQVSRNGLFGGENQSRDFGIQMEQEIADYHDDRQRQFSKLLEKQRGELSQIDHEITNLGINVSDLAETMQDIHFFAANAAVQLSPHDRQIFSSNIHMPRSYSSNSFVSNTSNGRGTSSYK